MFVVPSSGDSRNLSSFLTLEKKLDKANADLRVAEEKLLKAERLAAIGELAGMVGHDLRNPLQGMAGAAYYLKARNGSKLDDKGREMVATIETCIQRSNKIINDLLEYSKEIHLELRETNPKTLLENTLRKIEVPSTIRIENQTQNEPNFVVDGDKIERAFLNIIYNAFDAMPNGGKLTVTSEEKKNTVIFSFRDTGAGMTQEVMSKLWTPLFTTKAKGMGFGLPICKRIVEAHGGEINAETELGRGSIFRVALPLDLKPTSKEQLIFLTAPETMQVTSRQ
jgi:signal transduction histidine kinase